MFDLPARTQYRSNSAAMQWYSRNSMRCSISKRTQSAFVSARALSPRVTYFGCSCRPRRDHDYDFCTKLSIEDPAAGQHCKCVLYMQDRPSKANFLTLTNIISATRQVPSPFRAYPRRCISHRCRMKKVCTVTPRCCVQTGSLSPQEAL